MSGDAFHAWMTETFDVVCVPYKPDPFPPNVRLYRTGTTGFLALRALCEDLSSQVLDARLLTERLSAVYSETAEMALDYERGLNAPQSDGT